jgi:tryptophan 2,3-dioxygenase
MTALDPDVGGPDETFVGRSGYVEYTGIDTINELVAPRTDEPLEVTFVVVTQIMELHFTLLLHELRCASDRLAADDLIGALAALDRFVVTQGSLIASWDLLAPMSPVQYARFRDELGAASGFQSYSYRELEFRLGVKDANLMRPHAGMPVIHARLQRAYADPSIYDASIAYLARSGLVAPDPSPNAAPDAAPSGPSEPELSPELVELWAQVYRGDPELVRLADTLTAMAERHHRWRYVHYLAVRRILGAKPGTGGSAGLAWLKRTIDAPVFAELWEVRNVL